jgi:hypothetical protein
LSGSPDTPFHQVSPTDAVSAWRETELGIIGGAAHGLNSFLTGLTLATEIARSDDALPGETLDTIEQQSARLQREIELLFALLALERYSPQLHNPLELARSAARFFERLPVSVRGAVRISGSAGAVELDAGPSVRALVLCLRSFSAAFPDSSIRELELHVHPAEAYAGISVRCSDAAILPDPALLGAAAAMPRPDTGAVFDPATLTLRMQTPRR